jgi:hypothetical protein
MDHEGFMKIWNHYEKNEGLNSPNAHKDKSERMTVFAQSIERIIEHNTHPDSTYTKGINKFSDLTDEEFV